LEETKGNTTFATMPFREQAAKEQASRIKSIKNKQDRLRLININKNPDCDRTTVKIKFRPSRLGKHCQEQERAAIGHQRRHGARFGSHHAHLPGITRHHDNRQGKPYDIEIPASGGWLSEVISLWKRGSRGVYLLITSGLLERA